MKEMSYEDYVEFFDKFDFDSLETLNFLVPCVNKDEERAFIYVYNKKFDEEREEHEGINEYDDIARNLNFNVEKVKNSIDINKFNKSELAYFKKLLSNVFENTEEEYDDEDEEIDLSYNELLNMFEKYSFSELNVLGSILSYAKDYNLAESIKAFREVYYKKEESYYDDSIEEDETTKRYNIFEVSKILSKQELKYLIKLVDDASFYLSSVQDYSDEYENEIEDYDLDDYPTDLTNELLDSLNEEFESRKTNSNIKKKKR